jgi:hypothetical protein
MNKPVPVALLGLVLLACGGGTSVTDPNTPVATATAAPAMTAAASTGAQVVIAFYEDAACSQEVGRRRYDTGQSCFTWVAQGSNAQENSADRFQCYRDRICYTQHPNSLSCSGMATDKQSRTDVCLKEPAGRLYSRVVSGTDGCPPAPAGFECPVSVPGAGGR